MLSTRKGHSWTVGRLQNAIGKRIYCVLALAAALLFPGREAVADVTVWIAPADTVVAVGQPFTVRVMTDGPSSGLRGYSIRAAYDSAVLSVINITEGSVLQGHEYAFFPIVVPPDTCGFDAAVLGGTTAGPGSLGLITFLGMAGGVSPLHFSVAILRDFDNDQIPTIAVDGQVHVEYPTAVAPASWGRIRALYGSGH